MYWFSGFSRQTILVVIRSTPEEVWLPFSSRGRRVLLLLSNSGDLPKISFHFNLTSPLSKRKPDGSTGWQRTGSLGLAQATIKAAYTAWPWLSLRLSLWTHVVTFSLLRTPFVRSPQSVPLGNSRGNGNCGWTAEDAICPLSNRSTDLTVALPLWPSF